ncbi:MAG TPA: histidine--tRNA ligase [Edaphocola sp.]|nr:histidine--tRNA ligase [Edaphocola sp.]
MKPSIPQGMRDFSPAEVRKRQYILQTIKRVFELYAFQPLETPAMEQLSTLMGKYGEEGDRLIFKVLNNGLYEKKDKDKLQQEWDKMLAGPYSTSVLTERAMRYDLTIPFARYVVMHQNDLVFPFKRYQMQPVWRADRPQRGRYREFWQCDADVVGSNSLVNEAELISIYHQVFHELGVPQIKININSRKVLAALASVMGMDDKLVDITVAIDKLDKIGWEGVSKELAQRGLDASSIEFIYKYLSVSGDNEARLNAMEALLGENELAKAGLAELRTTMAYFEQMRQPEWTSELVVDFKLARGLNYYTGIIVEVTTSAVKMGSIGGGGRYDDLTGLFGLKGMSGVGVSFGIDRIYDVIEELGLFPQQYASGSKIILLTMDDAAEAQAIQYVAQLRKSGIPAEYYTEKGKFDKKMKYANKREIPFVGIIGTDELAQGKIAVKNMLSGSQETIDFAALLALLQQ